MNNTIALIVPISGTYSQRPVKNVLAMGIAIGKQR